MIVLDESIEILIPTQYTDVIQVCARDFTRMFGGVTLTQHEGFYTSKGGQILREEITSIKSYTTTDTLSEYVDSVQSLAEEIRTNLCQETVGVILDGKLLLVGS